MARSNADRSALRHRLFRILLGVQGSYYLVSGVWPLVSIETFQQVTGRKTDHMVTGRASDHWLVMTVGVLVTAIAVALLVTWWRKSEPIEIAILALASAIGLTAIDVIYVARKVILPIYLVDAALECVFIVLWIAVLASMTNGRRLLRR
jgi:hypothetical protein